MDQRELLTRPVAKLTMGGLSLALTGRPSPCPLRCAARPQTRLLSAHCLLQWPSWTRNDTDVAGFENASCLVGLVGM